MTRISTMLFGVVLAAATIAATPPGGGPGGGGMPGGQTEQGVPPQQTYPMSAPAPSPTTNPQLLAMAKQWFAQLQAGKIDRSQLDTGPYGNMTDASIANAQKMIGNLGPPVSFVQQQYQVQGNVSAAIYLVTFGNGQKVDFLFAVDRQGKVAGLSLGTPH